MDLSKSYWSKRDAKRGFLTFLLCVKKKQFKLPSDIKKLIYDELKKYYPFLLQSRPYKIHRQHDLLHEIVIDIPADTLRCVHLRVRDKGCNNKTAVRCVFTIYNNDIGNKIMEIENNVINSMYHRTNNITRDSYEYRKSIIKSPRTKITYEPNGITKDSYTIRKSESDSFKFTLFYNYRVDHLHNYKDPNHEYFGNVLEPVESVNINNKTSIKFVEGKIVVAPLKMIIKGVFNDERNKQTRIIYRLTPSQ